jgi:hypothetical protein
MLLITSIINKSILPGKKRNGKSTRIANTRCARSFYA